MKLRVPNLSYRLWVLSAVFVLSIAVVAMAYINHQLPQGRIHHHRQPHYSKDYFNYYLTADNTVDPTFASHLPLVIIDTGGLPPRARTVWDEEQQERIPTTVDPYVTGSINIVDNLATLNHLSDKPDFSSRIKIRLRGNSSLNYDKKQYLFKTVNSKGEEVDRNVLGMEDDSEWVLNISEIDKSLLRNYTCLNVAGEIMPFTPDVRFCEVLFSEEGTRTYQGVYLLMENVKQGKNRVNLGSYDPRDRVVSYLLRRDRYDPAAITLDTVGAAKEVPGKIEIKYPGDDISKEHIQNIEDEINTFETALYADNPQDFFKYRAYIDQQSFIDYFLINEFFGNYDAGYNSTYIYKQKGGSISMGPVWDFDQSMGNSTHSIPKVDSTAMHSAPWFNQLLRDEGFTEALIKRYRELRLGALNEKHVLSYLDEATGYLDSAIERDWTRWGHEYREPMFGSSTGAGNARVVSQADELKRMKSFLISHGRWLDRNIDSLYQFVQYEENDAPKTYIDKTQDLLFGDNYAGRVQGILALTFFGAFIICIVLIQRL